MKTLYWITLVMMVGFLSACGKSKSIAVTSGAFTTSGSGLISFGRLVAPPVTEFKICVNRIKLQAEDGKYVNESGEKEDESESSEIVFAPGLIDLSDGTAKDWGNVTVPTGFMLSKLKIKVHHDPEACGVAYSVAFNGQTTQQDIEFKWKFDPAVDFTANQSALTLSFNSVVAALRAAADAGTLSSLKDHIEGVEDSAEME